MRSEQVTDILKGATINHQSSIISIHRERAGLEESTSSSIQN